MDQRAQISLEYILFAALAMLAVLVFANIIADQTEMNNIATAAREGASNATAQISILNSSMTPVRATKTDMTTNTTTGIINLNIKLSSNLSAAQKSTILNAVMQSINSAGYHNITNNTVTTSRHVYTIFIA